ncbi:hypothetical protein CSW08_04090 [Confluentibacter flavum]|uniref:Uncharacterized protein n=1 Tax=Confluentibacter flavum TaxID=1909700 RepID=A0A2N3HMZ6_9FLAO|nr:hypothetical protein CSW08_04090 [Confluentibacter flavum]
MILFIIKSLFKFYPLALLCAFFRHTSAIFRFIAMAMNLKTPSSDKKIPYKTFQKQNLNSL